MASMNTGSDDASELFCQPCMDDGEHLPAEGYCTDCQDYLCSTCFASHRRARAYKNHMLQNMSQIPKSLVSSVMVDKCSEQCTQHKGELISFYCKSHDQLGCEQCKTIGHISCQVGKLENISKGISESAEYKDLMGKLCGLKQKYDGALSLSKTQVDEVEDNYSKALKAFKDVIRKLKQEDLKKMKSITDTSSAVLKEIEGTTTKLETLQRTNQNSQMFVVMKNTTRQIKLFEDSLHKITTDNKINRYEFKVLEQSVNGTDILGQLSMLSIVSATDTAGNKLGQLSVLPVKPVFVGDINVTSTTDTASSTTVTGSCLLPGNQLIIADNNNKKVKLVDLNHNKITSEVQLTSNPYDVTLIGNNTVAVTLSYVKKIQFLHTSSRALSKGREIKVNGNCYGIVHNGGRLIVIYSQCKLEMIDMNGQVLRSVTQDAGGAQLFIKPQYVAISPDKTAIYVSDFNKNTVTCMSMDGTVKSVYKDDALLNPTGLAVDKTGVVYVVGYTSNNIHQITAACTKIHIIQGQEHGILGPYSLTYCDREDKLYVGIYGNSIIKVFKVK